MTCRVYVEMWGPEGARYSKPLGPEHETREEAKAYINTVANEQTKAFNWNGARRQLFIQRCKIEEWTMTYFKTEDGKEAFEPAGFHPGGGWVPCSKAEHDRIVKASAIARLAFIQPGAGITTVAIGNSGTQHKVFAVHEGGILDITWLVAKACGFRLTKDRLAIMQGGGGYSKSFQIVYSLGRTLWPNGTPEPHGVRNGEPDSDGGYALRRVGY